MKAVSEYEKICRAGGWRPLSECSAQVQKAWCGRSFAQFSLSGSLAAVSTAYDWPELSRESWEVV